MIPRGTYHRGVVPVREKNREFAVNRAGRLITLDGKERTLTFWGAERFCRSAAKCFAASLEFSTSYISSIITRVSKEFSLDKTLVEKIHKYAKGQLTPKESYELFQKIQEKENSSRVKKLMQACGKSKLSNSIKELQEFDRSRKKWTGLKLDAAIFDRHPLDAHFLAKSRILFSIVGYQNSTQEGQEKHKIEEGTDGLYILVEGKKKSVADLRQEFEIDMANFCLVKKGKKDPQAWYYFGNGLVPQDRFMQHHLQDKYPELIQNADLKPILQLSTEEHGKLVAHGQKFWKDKKVPQGKCVLQFFTHPRKIGGKDNSQFPVHCGIRIVDEKGAVYSTGFGSTLKEDEYSDGLRSYFSTINGQPTQLDYEEFRPHEGRVTTTITIDKEHFDDILQSLNQYRKDTIRFNILKQNCMKLGVHVASKAGVPINIRIPLSTKISRALNADRLSLKKSKVYRAASEKTPQIVKKVIKAVADFFLYIPRLIGRIALNLFALALGSRVRSPNKNSGEYDEKSKSGQEYGASLSNMERLHSKTLRSLASKGLTDIEDSSVFLHWQLEQASTEVAPYKGIPSMSLLPLEECDRNKSEADKDRLKAIFASSTPVCPCPTVEDSQIRADISDTESSDEEVEETGRQVLISGKSSSSSFVDHRSNPFIHRRGLSFRNRVA